MGYMMPFMIRFIKQVTFSNMDGHLTQVFKKGDLLRAARDTGTHYITGMGNIYYDEAERSSDVKIPDPNARG
jgi:hypothetical protein